MKKILLLILMILTISVSAETITESKEINSKTFDKLEIKGSISVSLKDIIVNNSLDVMESASTDIDDSTLNGSITINDIDSNVKINNSKININDNYSIKVLDSTKMVIDNTTITDEYDNHQLFINDGELSINNSNINANNNSQLFANRKNLNITSSTINSKNDLFINNEDNGVLNVNQTSFNYPDNTVININNNSQITMNGNTFNYGGETLFNTVGDKGVITIENNQFKKDFKQLINTDKTVALFLTNQEINSNINTHDKGYIRVVLNNSNFNGTLNGNIALELSNDSKLKLTGDTYLTTLYNNVRNNSNIDLNGYKLYVDNKEFDMQKDTTAPETPMSIILIIVVAIVFIYSLVNRYRIDNDLKKVNEKKHKLLKKIKIFK